MGNTLFCLAFSLLYAMSNSSNPSRSVNVALETSLLFQPGDDENNYDFINKIRSFIDQIEQAITPVKAFLRTRDNKNESKIMSNFMERITLSIIKYDDENLKDVAKLLATETEKFLNRMEIFNIFIKNAIVHVLKEYSRVHPTHIRNNLQNAIIGNEVILTRLGDTIDKYFDDNDKVKLDALIGRSDKLAGDKSPNTKTEIKNIINELFNILKAKYETLDGTDKNQINRDFSNILQHVDLSKIYLRDNNKFRNYNKRKQNKSNNKSLTKNTHLNDTAKAKEIVLNKDLEIFVKSIKNPKDDKDVNKNNLSKENDFDVNKLDNNSVDLSTVLDELNKS